jgi:regulator of protease activity HflC (stomatin/prohibitin superfamily)
MDGLLGLLAFLVPLIVVLFSVAGSAVKVVQEYERGVIFRLGRLVGARGPGLFFIIPFVDRMVKIDLRVVTLEVPPQEVITRDNVTVRVNAVLYFRVFNPEKAVVAVTDYVRATHQIAQTTLRSVLGQSDLDELLSQREDINMKLQQIIDEQTEPWGIKVGIVEVKDVELPQSMQRAMARQAEAEREKRAKIIHASGEFDASKMLSEAARIIGSEPATIQLRYLQTLTEIASEKNSTIVFPIPIEFLSLIPNVFANTRGGGDGRDGRDGSGPQISDAPPATDTLPIGATAGSLPEGSAGSLHPDATPDSGLPDIDEMRSKELAAEHARFMQGDIVTPDDEETLPGRRKK